MQHREDAFPPIDPGVQPLGSRVLLQIRSVKQKTAGGILLVEETSSAEKWNTQVAKVIAVGPLAFRDRKTMEPWLEGAWANPGDFVRCPKYGGDRWEVQMKNGESALFVIFNDLDIIGQVTGDPLSIKAFI